MAYIEEMVSVGKVENGWMITVHVPYSEDAEPGLMMERSKTFYVEDVEDLGPKLTAILPALTDKMDAEDVFAKTFKENS